MPRKKANPKAPAVKPTARTATGSALPIGYSDLLADLKARIRSAQLKAAVAVNRELIGLYWQIGLTDSIMRNESVLSSRPSNSP